MHFIEIREGIDADLLASIEDQIIPGTGNTLQQEGSTQVVHVKNSNNPDEEQIVPSQAHMTGDVGNPAYAEELKDLVEDTIVPSQAHVTGDRGNTAYTGELNQIEGTTSL